MMNTPPRRFSFSQKPSSGFALIVALSLMAFIILLLLSMSMLVRIESVNSSTQNSLSVARQNALFGLRMAMGQLQKELGPDQRISATASLLDSDPYDDDYEATSGVYAADGVSPARQHWTGVWGVSTGADGYPRTTLRQWLVSGFERTHTGSPTDVAATAPDFEEPVELLGGSAPVEAGKVDIVTDGVVTGRYAYWIGDEGVKAKVNLSAAAGDEALSPRYFGLNAMSGLDWLASNTGGDIEKVLSYPTFKVLAGSAQEDSVRQRFHDLTYYSRGVLSDTLDGGLKKDLTTELFGAGGTLSGPMFAPRDGMVSVADPGGPRWEQLRSWVAIEPNDTGDYPVRESTATQAGMFPVLTGFQIYLMPTYDPDGRIRVNLMPAVTLWNPYNVPLESKTYTVTFGYTRNTGSSYNKFGQYFIEPLTIVTDPDTADEKAIEDAYRGEGVTLELTSGVLQPGQALVFSPSDLAAPYSISGNNKLAAGYNPTNCFYRYAKEPTLDAAKLPLTPTDPTFEYYWDPEVNGGTTRVLAIRLSTGSGAAEEILQESVYLCSQNSKTYQTQVRHYLGKATLHPSPVSGAALGTTAGAIGFKVLHTYIDNVPCWKVEKAIVWPDTRCWLGQNNPRARMHGPLPYSFAGASYYEVTTNPSYGTMMHIGGDERALGFDAPVSRVPVGYSENTIDETVLFQPAPGRADLRSIGQLMHAPLFYDGGDLHTQMKNAYFGNLIPAYVIGNSRADPYIPLDAVDMRWADGPGTTNADYAFDGVHHDFSYKLNAALWDRYFFSTLPGTAADNSPENPRLVAAPATGDEPRSDIDQAAADLLVEGAFNINSTSVEAWRALLASFYEDDVTRRDGMVDDAGVGGQHSPYLRTDVPVAGPLSDPTVADADAFRGYRRLDADQIEDLAESIVEEIKLRGPFGSLAQFVNRMPGRDAPASEDSENAFRLRGALAAAIDKAGINAGLQEGSMAVVPSGIAGVVPEAEAGWRTENIPGWLSQADLLARLGSVLSARSDTFRIRAYGESINPVTGETVSAMCEAVLQRVPEFVDSETNVAHTPVQADEAAAAGLAVLSGTNELLGRRFVVVDFQWLSDEEI